MDISFFKDALSSLVDENKIINRGKDGKESYFIAEDIHDKYSINNNILQTDDGVPEVFF